MVTIMKDSEILKAVRADVEKTGKYICWAISDTGLGTAEQRDALRLWIRKSLSFHSTYESWLHHAHPKKCFKMKHDDFRQGRLAWLDWMIAQCEKAEARNAEV